MTSATRPYWIIAALFVLSSLGGLFRAQYAVATGLIAMAISFVLFAPPRTRNKTIAAYVFVAIALISAVIWLIGQIGFKV